MCDLLPDGFSPSLSAAFIQGHESPVLESLWWKNQFLFEDSVENFARIIT